MNIAAVLLGIASEGLKFCNNVSEPILQIACPAGGGGVQIVELSRHLRAAFGRSRLANFSLAVAIPPQRETGKDWEHG